MGINSVIVDITKILDSVLSYKVVITSTSISFTMAINMAKLNIKAVTLPGSISLFFFIYKLNYLIKFFITL